MLHTERLAHLHDDWREICKGISERQDQLPSLTSMWNCETLRRHDRGHEHEGAGGCQPWDGHSSSPFAIEALTRPTTSGLEDVFQVLPKSEHQGQRLPDLPGSFSP